MSATLILVQLAGYVVLLLWGMRMVHSGVVRAYGSNLRRVMGSALSNRFGAVLAGMVVTILLQSSTATALMATSFAADGIVALLPALAVMLGANIGTALVVKLLSFDISEVSPILLIAGYAAFGHAPKGRTHDLGRVGIGLGLMLLALRMIVATIQPAQTAPMLGELLAALTREPILAIALAAGLTWIAHSSVATMLLIVSLSGANVITPVGALALALGANLGSAIPPVLAAGRADPAARRLPVGNLLFRFAGVCAVAPFIHPIAEFLWQNLGDSPANVVDFHLGFSIALAAVFVGLLDPAARALTRLFPERAGEPDPGRALFLDETALETPYLALANATREVLRMADIVEGMLNRAMQAMGARDRAAIDAVERTGKAVERLRDAIKSYLSRLAAEPLAEPDSRRAGIMLDLVVNLGHAAGIVERTLAATAARTIKRGVALTAEDEADIAAFHARVAAALRLSISTFLTGDPRSAHELLDAKRRLNETERAATRAHLARLDPCRPERLEASTMYLALLRDLRRINSHLSAIAYDVLEIGAPGGDEAVERDAESEGVGN